jgi:hypothetical protein
MKWLRRSRTSIGSPDIVRLLASALAQEHDTKTVVAAGDAATRPAAIPDEDFHARAQSLLYDFAMQHFTGQVEVLRREAVVEHLANHAQDRMSFPRLVAIGTCATLLALGVVELGERAALHFDIDVALLQTLAKPIAASLRAAPGA